MLASEENISNLFGVAKKYIDKTKIYIFVLGRHHANYSSNVIADDSCAWGHWYQFMSDVYYIDESRPKLSQFYNLLNRQSPFKQRYIEKPMKFQIGKYKIICGNRVKI